MRWGEGEIETLWVPRGSTILTAEIVYSTNPSGTDSEKLNLFFQEPEDIRFKQHHYRKFVYYYTGTEFRQKNVVYVKSVIHGVLIYHVFEVFDDE
jgi:hypothetical protein